MSSLPLYNQPASLSLLALINASTLQNFSADQLVFADPISGPVEGETTVTVTPADSTGLTGALPYIYRRLDLATFFLGGTPVLYIQGVVTPQAILDALLNQFQIYSSDDPHDSFTITLAGDSASCTVAASPTHYVWTGQLTFAIDQRPLLASQLQTTAFEGFTLPTGQSVNRPNAQVYYGLLDGQGVADECAALSSGALFAPYLTSWDLGKQLTGEAWYSNPAPGPFNLYGAVVAYNGPAVGSYAIQTSAGPYQGNVLVITLGLACTNRCGSLLVLYQSADSLSAPPTLMESAPNGNLLAN